MSLLDDVSIVITPNGYKAGELYAVIPVPTEGAEEGTNMDFSSGTSPWALNSNWSLGGVGVIADGTSNSTIWQGSVLEDNKQYIVTYTLTDFLQGSVNVELSGSNGISRTIAGTYTEVITSGTSPTTRLSFEGSGNFKVTLSNVIVKEYTSADMDVTRNTAATRVDENGLVNYAEIIGGELVDNGSFTTDSDWNKGTGWTISGGNASFNTTTNNSLTQSGFANSKIYKVSIDVVSYVRGNPFIAIGQGSQYTIPTSIGTHIIYVTSGSVDAILRIYSGAFGSGGEGSIDNVSVKEAARDNVPRIDYTGGGCPHILAEPMRTNLIPYSEDLTEWNKGNSTIDSNDIVSPDGTQNADTITVPDSNEFIYESITTTESTEYVFSFYVKRGTIAESALKLAVYDDTANSFIVVDVSYSASDSEWTRVTQSFTTPVGCIKIRAYAFRNSSSTLGTFSIWGGQVEAGSYGTSYIPNFGTVAGVTRNRDIFTRDGIGSLINSTEGVLFVEMALLIDEGIAKYITLSDGITDNFISINFDYSSSRIQYRVDSGGVLQSNIKVSYSGTNMDKIAAKWKVGTNEASLWINGVELGTDTITSAPIGLNTLKFNSTSDSGNFFGKVKQLQVYDTALTDEQLEALTS